ncbi:hypothetical protein LXL04_026362 [Taraxacum kok-saghyz]
MICIFFILLEVPTSISTSTQNPCTHQFPTKRSRIVILKIRISLGDSIATTGSQALVTSTTDACNRWCLIPPPVGYNILREMDLGSVNFFSVDSKRLDLGCSFFWSEELNELIAGMDLLGFAN